jgi:hypothetical protein
MKLFELDAILLTFCKLIWFAEYSEANAGAVVHTIIVIAQKKQSDFWKILSFFMLVPPE